MRSVILDYECSWIIIDLLTIVMSVCFINPITLQQNDYTHRRMSDPSQAFNSFMQRTIKKSRSETENVDIIGTEGQEVEAGTLQDGM